MIAHPLDNHMWHALNGSLARYSHGGGAVRLLDPEIGPAAALAEITPANLSSLAAALPYGSEFAAIAPQPIPTTAGLEVVHVKPLLQMVAEHPRLPEVDVSVHKLDAADFPKMLALVEITRPGPLGPRAMELGGFHGIDKGGRLVALAGERLHLDGYTEVATVCTHPDYRGRSYGKAVVSAVMRGIVESGQRPFLGVDADNIPAIRLYESLGFTYRSTFYLSTVRRLGPG